MIAAVIAITIVLCLLILGVWGAWYAMTGQGSVASRWLSGVFGCSALGILSLGVFLVVSPVFRSAREAGKNTACIANMHQIGKAMLMYAAESDERLPIGAWTDAIVGYVGDRSTYSCPMLNAPYGYSMNSEVIGLDTSTVDGARTVAAFDGPGGKDNIAGASSVQFRHNGDMAVFLFVDGHCRRTPESEMPPLALQLTTKP